MRVLFADTFYFLGLLNHLDQFAEEIRAFNKLFRGRIVTTDWVLMEVADAFASSQIRARIQEYISYLRTLPNWNIIEADRELFDHALKLYNQRPDKDWSLTDCTSFIVMRERGITDALTGDKHFEQAGFIPLFR